MMKIYNYNDLIFFIICFIGGIIPIFLYSAKSNNALVEYFIDSLSFLGESKSAKRKSLFIGTFILWGVAISCLISAMTPNNNIDESSEHSIPNLNAPEYFYPISGGLGIFFLSTGIYIWKVRKRHKIGLFIILLALVLIFTFLINFIYKAF